VTAAAARGYLCAVTKTRIAVIAGAVLVAIQLVPVSRSNPPVESTVPAPPEVLSILRRACFDCHSHETVWPVPQAYLAPVSWLVARDVSEGRGELNFSRWNAMGQKALAKVASKLPKEVAEKEMPPALYLLAHPGAKLSDADRAALQAWGSGLADGSAR